MEQFVITREYDSRKYGRIGSVELVADVETMTLNGAVLEKRTVEWLLTFALQTFQDAYAGADSPDAAREAFDAKVKRAMENAIGVRESSGGGLDNFTEKAMRSAFGEKTRAEYKKLKDVKERAAFIAEKYAGLSDAVRERIDATADEYRELARKEKERAAKIANSLDAEI